MTARHTATAAMGVILRASSAGQPGRSSMDRYSPPGGERKVRPFLPRPVLWAAAMYTVPSGAPWAASCLILVLVESTRF